MPMMMSLFSCDFFFFMETDITTKRKMSSLNSGEVIRRPGKTGSRSKRNSTSEPEIKIKKKNMYVLLGSSGVGKTCIMRRFDEGDFSIYTSTTLDCSFRKKILKVDDYHVQLDVWDTSGQERFKAICPIYYRRADAAIIVYDITNYDTFEQAKYWYNELLKYGPPDIVKVLVGNKVDLVEKRQVNERLAENYAKLRDMIFFETSAKEDINIQDVFSAVARTTPDPPENTGVIRLTGYFSREESSDEENEKSYLRRILECPFAWFW